MEGPMANVKKTVTMGLMSQRQTEDRALLPRFARKPGMKMFASPAMAKMNVSIPSMKTKLSPMSSRKVMVKMGG